LHDRSSTLGETEMMSPGFSEMMERDVPGPCAGHGAVHEAARPQPPRSPDSASTRKREAADKAVGDRENDRPNRKQ